MMLQVECTYFFEENPFALETLESLATRLGRSVDDLIPVLDRLVELTVLTRIGSGDQSVYRYNRPVTVYRNLRA
jgi:hypothetical protein